MVATHCHYVRESNKRQKGMERWLLGNLISRWCHRTLFLQQHISLTALLEGKSSPRRGTSMKAALGLQCFLALHICQPYSSPYPRLMDETCSPCYRSPEDISGLIIIDLFTPSGSQLPSFALVPTCSDISKLPPFSLHNPGPIHLPKWTGAPVNLCPPRAETGTKNSASHEKGELTC